MAGLAPTRLRSWGFRHALTRLGADMVQVTLPQNLLDAPGTLFEDFEAAAEWVITGGTVGTAAENVAEVKTGTKSLKLTTVAGQNTSFNKAISAVVPAGATTTRIFIYRHGATGGAAVYFAEGADFTRFWVEDFTTANLAHTGWNTFNIVPGDWSGTGAPSWANTMLRARVRAHATPGAESHSFDTLRTGVAARPAVLFTFDDGNASVASLAYPYMRSRDVVGTAYAITDLVGTAGYMTAAQLQEMDANGWDIGNHTSDHTNLSTLTQAQAEAKLTAAKAALDGWGLTRASSHVAYPYGGYNADTLAAMDATGMLTGRTILDARNPVLPYGDNRQIQIKNIINTTALATAKGYVDTAIARGEVLVLLFHIIVDGEATVNTQWPAADFRALVDYVVEKQIQPLAISNFYDLQSAPVAVRKPHA